MAGRTRGPEILGQEDSGPIAVCPARSPGPLGILDQGDSSIWALSGAEPGPAGAMFNMGSPGWWEQTLLASTKTVPAQGTPQTHKHTATDAELSLAAVLYGESSAEDLLEEMQAIGSTLVRYANCKGKSLGTFTSPSSTYAFGASNNNPRTHAFRQAMEAAKNPKTTGKGKTAKHPITAGMETAIEAAQDTIDGTTDYSNGAYFWDGLDIKTNPRHPKLLQGIHFTNPAHNIYKLKETTVDGKGYIYFPKPKEKKLRGTYSYTYESTAAYGGTIFWKYSDAFMKAMVARPCA